MAGERIGRRRFLKRMAGSVVGLFGTPYFVPSLALGNAGSVAPSNRVVMGFVGLGTQGTVWAEPESLLTSTIGKDEIHLIESRGHQRNFLDAVKTRERTICPMSLKTRPGHSS